MPLASQGFPLGPTLGSLSGQAAQTRSAPGLPFQGSSCASFNIGILPGHDG